MKKFLMIAVIFSFAAMFAQHAEASTYKLDNQKVDAMFESATEADFSFLTEDFTANPNITSAVMADKDPIVAIVLNFFLGQLGVHRFYLGTKVMTGIGYILTCGGIFGVVPLIDFIMLIINYDDISKFVDNPKFFMWA
jgi:TM2 domain-containing membrane protein YozV